MFSFACISNQVDVTGIAKSLPEVQEFLNQYPDAEIKASLWSESAINRNIDAIRQDCEQLDVKSHWKVQMASENIDLTV